MHELLRLKNGHFMDILAFNIDVSEKQYFLFLPYKNLNYQINLPAEFSSEQKAASKEISARHRNKS